MPGTRQSNTFGEMLQKLIKDIAIMQTAPDADVPWCMAIQEECVNKMRSGVEGLEASGASAVPGDPGLGAAIGMQGAMGGGPMGGVDPAMMGAGGPGEGAMPPGGPAPANGVGSGVPGVNSMPGDTGGMSAELQRILGQG